MTKEMCPCGKEVTVMAFRGTGVCSVNCKKAYVGDVSSVGTMMFVTQDEKEQIMEARNG